MSKLNRWLVTSMIDDIREFITVENEMCSWIGKVEQLSWRFPTRSARNVNVMAILQNHKGSAGEMYILLLEMAYDRMHFVLRLVIEFLDSYPFIEEFFKDQVARVKRPRNMSMANVIRTLWNRLKFIPETITRNMIKTKHLENSVFANQISRGCQASGSLLYCESCSCASKAIKNLANIFSTVLQEINSTSVIDAERGIICADIFEKTQWGVMTKFVEAIEEDVQILLKTTSATRMKSETEVKQHEKCLKSLTVEFEKQRTEKNFLETKVRELTDQLDAVNSQLEKLKDTQMESEEENHVLNESLYDAKEKLSNSGWYPKYNTRIDKILLAVTVRQMAEIAESKVALENVVKNLNKKVTVAREVYTIDIEKLEKSLNRLQEDKVLTEKRYHKEVEELKQRHEEIVEKLQEDARLSVDHLSTEIEVEKCAYKTGEILIPKGDPEIDMAQQLASNEKTIERLTRQNERLSRTLNRLKEHRRILNIRTIVDRN